MVCCNQWSIIDNGELFTWGRAGPYLGYEVENSNKQLRPRRVTHLENHRVTQVACGCTHTLGKKLMQLILWLQLLLLTVCTESNQVFSFGTNEYGELGLGHEQPCTVPSLVPVENGAAIYRIGCGRNHSAAVDGMFFFGTAMTTRHHPLQWMGDCTCGAGVAEDNWVRRKS